MKKITAVLCVLTAGCATDLAGLDHNVFRQSENKLTRIVTVQADIAASNIEQNGAKCWESDSIRTKNFKETSGYVVTIGVYGEFTKQILIMADAKQNQDGSSTVTVTYMRQGHKEFAENLLDWADKRTTECHSPMNRRASK